MPIQTVTVAQYWESVDTILKEFLPSWVPSYLYFFKFILGHFLNEQMSAQWNQTLVEYVHYSLLNLASF